MRAPFPAWKELLLLLRFPRQDVDMRRCLLARDSPEIKKERELTRAIAMKNVQAHSHSKGLPQWRVWEYEHQAVRSAMGPIDAPAPAHEQTCSELEASSGEVELSWDVSYCRRERDLLTLFCKHADLQGQLTETSLTFLDIGEMASHARTMPARLIPPLVTGHKIYIGLKASATYWARSFCSQWVFPATSRRGACPKGT